MAVELQYLYREIRPEYEVKLHTVSCYDKDHQVGSGFV